ncbi:antitoxin family protein [Aeropyrum pernix]|uniref:antitoxin family protein n=1 Tax=Aeropyrum pernix TaxID=56636 RepID=UPI00103739E2|nr:antitoxin family protein [Aeropyrum pernix]
MSKIVRARYEKGVLKPLEEIGLREGEEVLIKIERLEERERIIEEYKGFMGDISEEELEELIEEAELEKL